MLLNDLKKLQWQIIGSNGQTSNIFKATHKGKIIIKKHIKPAYKQEYLNEVSCLKALKESTHFPQLINYDDHNLIIYMSYCGQRLYPTTRPLNWKSQIQTIIKTILEKDIVYSDIKIDHLRVYNDNTIRLIDFGRSTVGPQEKKQDIHKIYNLAENVKYE